MAVPGDTPHPAVIAALQVKDDRWSDQNLDWDQQVSRILLQTLDDIKRGASGPLETRGAEVCLVLTSDAEVQALNKDWRGNDAPTNVLSFPAGDVAPATCGPAEDLVLGDVVLAFETIAREAKEQQKTFRNHATHLVVHGLLHLLGYDHQNDDQAGQMEGLERRILANLGITDPYTRMWAGD